MAVVVRERRILGTHPFLAPVSSVASHRSWLTVLGPNLGREPPAPSEYFSPITLPQPGLAETIVVIADAIVIVVWLLGALSPNSRCLVFEGVGHSPASVYFLVETSSLGVGS